MPVRVELKTILSPERIPLRHIHPGDAPFTLHDYTSDSRLVIAAICRQRNKGGEIYHIPDAGMSAFPDAQGVPEELLTADNLHTSIPHGGSYEREVTMEGGGEMARFIFTHF